jgi:hypothetical protein
MLEEFRGEQAPKARADDHDSVVPLEHARPPMTAAPMRTSALRPARRPPPVAWCHPFPRKTQ